MDPPKTTPFFVERKGENKERLEPIPPNTLIILGSPSSPYTQKVLGVLRYRRIAHRYVIILSDSDSGFKRPPGHQLRPTFNFGPFIIDGKEQIPPPMNDSTPMIRFLEKLQVERSVIPSPPYLRWINDLIEDYADEWASRAMFHFRWGFPSDIDRASKLLRILADPTIDEGMWKERTEYIGNRQVKSLNAAEGHTQMVTRSFKNMIKLLDAHLQGGYPFLFGSRPSSADFALFAQMIVGVWMDRSSGDILEKLSLRVLAWLYQLMDLSGLYVNENLAWKTEIPSTLKNILKEIGFYYPLFMLTNAKGVMENKKEIKMEKDGVIWMLRPRSYPAKCLEKLRKDYKLLPEKDQNMVQEILSGTGCEILIEIEPKSRL